MNSSDTITHAQLGFDSSKYLTLQQEAIAERISHFKGTLYLEIGGKFLFDPHAQRVLPGFDPHIKPKIIHGLKTSYELIFCVNAKDIEHNRMLTNKDEAYTDATLQILQEYRKEFPVPVTVAINLVTTMNETLESFRDRLKNEGYTSFLRYAINNYPNPQAAIAETGYARDEYHETSAPLVLVIGPASNSGKMSTCLGQIYHDEKNGKDSGYAKYELFPIWNLPLKHPVNLAYEAATADIGDYNLYDYHHERAYHTDAVNYNRDVEAFPIITNLLKEIIPKTNYLQQYRSPTDMGMNKAGFAITDDRVVALAGLEEIKRRKTWYQEQVIGGRGKVSWVERCVQLEKEAEVYLKHKV